jgi:PKD repeat protein
MRIRITVALMVVLAAIFLLSGCIMNQPPIADISWQPERPIAGQEVIFSSASYDPDGSIVQCEWKFLDGGVTGNSVVKKFAFPGSYEIQLTVSDDSGVTDKVTKILVVENPPPPADPQDPKVELAAFVARIGPMKFEESYKLNLFSMNKGIYVGEEMWFGVQAWDPDDEVNISRKGIIPWINPYEASASGISEIKMSLRRPNGSVREESLNIENPEFWETLSLIGEYILKIVVFDNDFPKRGTCQMEFYFMVEYPPEC